MNRRPSILIFLLLAMLSSCGAPLTAEDLKCGSFIDKWRQGDSGSFGMVAIRVNDTIWIGSVDDITYAKAENGQRVCVNVW